MVLLVKRDTTITRFYSLLVSEFAADRELFEQLLVEAILLNLKTTLRSAACEVSHRRRDGLRRSTVAMQYDVLCRYTALPARSQLSIEVVHHVSVCNLDMVICCVKPWTPVVLRRSETLQRYSTYPRMTDDVQIARSSSP